MSGLLKSHTHGATLILTLHNPAGRNTIDREMCTAAVEALNVADSNPEIHSVIITGSGPDFSDGSLLHPTVGQAGTAPSTLLEDLEPLHNLIETLHSFSKPVVAAIEGCCNDTGFSVALACDFLIAARDSTFALKQVSHGHLPEGGITWCLARSLPRSMAMKVLMLGDAVSSNRLAELGIVSSLANSGQAEQEAIALCQTLNRWSGKALRSIKEMANDAKDLSLNAHLRLEKDHIRRQPVHWHPTGESLH